ncbi:MAG: hypothetical protein ACI976_000596, partial [Aureispira sp.]
MMSKIEDIQKKYQSLNNFQKDLVKLLVLIDSPENKTKLLQVCLKAKLKAGNKQSYNVINIGQSLEFLRGIDLVKKNLDQKYQIHPDVYHFVVQQAIADKRLKVLRKTVVTISPGIKNPYQAYRYPNELIRDASFAMYNDDYPTFQLAVKTLQKDSSFYIETLYKKLFIERYGINNIPNLSPEFQFEFYKSQLGPMIVALKDVNEPLKNIQKIASTLKGKDLDLVHHYLSLHALLKGDWVMARKIWEGKDSVNALKFKGWLYFA